MADVRRGINICPYQNVMHHLRVWMWNQNSLFGAYTRKMVNRHYASKKKRRNYAFSFIHLYKWKARSFVTCMRSIKIDMTRYFEWIPLNRSRFNASIKHRLCTKKIFSFYFRRYSWSWMELEHKAFHLSLFKF